MSAVESFKAVVLGIKPGLSDYQVGKFRKLAIARGVAGHEGFNGHIVVKNREALKVIVLGS